MPERSKELEGSSIVVLGAFNPAIFHPEWFGRYNLIRPDESEAAKIDVVHTDIAIFSLDWLVVQVTQGRLFVATSDPTKQVLLHDLVVGVFKILEHVPVSAYGLNRDLHYRMLSTEDLHEFGHRTAPKSYWLSVLEEPGLLQMTMQGRRAGQTAEGRIQIRVEPSSQFPNGLFFGINEHHELTPDERKPGSAARLIHGVTANWRGFLTYSDGVAPSLFAAIDKAAGSASRP